MNSITAATTKDGTIISTSSLAKSSTRFDNGRIDPRPKIRSSKTPYSTPVLSIDISEDEDMVVAEPAVQSRPRNPKLSQDKFSEKWWQDASVVRNSTLRHMFSRTVNVNLKKIKALEHVLVKKDSEIRKKDQKRPKNF